MSPSTALALALALLGSAAARAAEPAASPLARGFHHYRAGEYAAAAEALRPLVGDRTTKNPDYVLYLLGESEAYAGEPARARGRFEALARLRSSRFAPLGPWRAADCLWAEGKRPQAAALYKKLLKEKTPAGDLAVARFRIAEALVDARPGEAKTLFLGVATDFPGHPLAVEAGRRATGKPGRPGKPGAEAELPPRDRLRRADTLDEAHRWQEALDELGRLPATLAPDLAALRDYQIGMTKYHMRRDYAAAGELLLAVEPKLSGDKASSAAFHGARALSRADRDDEAIRGYRAVVQKYPRSRWAPEAQYLSGWLEFNRGNYRAALPGLAETLERYGSSAFADDAAWHLAYARYLLGDGAEALAALDRYQRIAHGDADGRARYWRARLLASLGREDEARDLLRDVARRMPLGYYGILARTRLRQPGEDSGPSLPHAGDTALHPPPAAAVLARDALLARADELVAAGLDVEAGREIERDEAGLLRRLGTGPALAVLFDRYRSGRNFRRAMRLAESRSDGALSAAPEGPARTFWEAAYPLAFRELVEQYGPPAGNPDHLLYAVMRKESAFNPHDVSYADARGLLQMIPPTSARVAAVTGIAFGPEDLYDPEINIRLGAAYIGALHRKFKQQIPLTAGAFNAGPRAMARWCDQHGGRPLDEFVELIAFAQTREYVKRVIAIYARYRQLYGPTPYELPLTLDVKYDKTGPDY